MGEDEEEYVKEGKFVYLVDGANRADPYSACAGFSRAAPPVTYCCCSSTAPHYDTKLHLMLQLAREPNIACLYRLLQIIKKQYPDKLFWL